MFTHIYAFYCFHASWVEECRKGIADLTFEEYNLINFLVCLAAADVSIDIIGCPFSFFSSICPKNMFGYHVC